MKLNHDCVRDLMLAIENFHSATAWYSVSSMIDDDLENKYSLEEVCYATLCLKEAGYIKATCTIDLKAYTVQRLTWSGHEFLDNIRDNETWKVTKDISSKLSSVSLTLMASLAKAYLLKKFGLS